jgi:Fe-S-cluster containining protein
MSGTSPCATCSSRCCADYTVTVTGYDAWRIGRGLCLDPESFLVYFPLADQEKAGFVLAPGGTRYDIALDKVGAFRKGNPCIFWMDFRTGRGRCGIYRLRPFVCQTYPAYLANDSVLLRDDVYCPQGAWHLVAMDLPDFRRRLQRFRSEQDVYGSLVQRWNRHVEQTGATHAVRGYYAYLWDAYDEIEGAGAAAPPAAGAAG